MPRRDGETKIKGKRPGRTRKQKLDRRKRGVSRTLRRDRGEL